LLRVRAKLQHFFLLWWISVFAGVFGENVRADVVLLWSFCGGMRGKRGQLTDTFCRLKNRTPLPTLFLLDRL
jgi:hypothetical protein